MSIQLITASPALAAAATQVNTLLGTLPGANLEERYQEALRLVRLPADHPEAPSRARRNDLKAFTFASHYGMRAAGR